MSDERKREAVQVTELAREIGHTAEERLVVAGLPEDVARELGKKVENVIHGRIRGRRPGTVPNPPAPATIPAPPPVLEGAEPPMAWSQGPEGAEGQDGAPESAPGGIQ